MSNPKAPSSSQVSRSNWEVVSLNRGSSQSQDSPEQIHLDKIFQFKFTECNVQATKSGTYREDRNEKHLVAADLCERLCTLARMVISCSHVITLWKNAVYEKSVGDHTTVDKSLTYCVVIVYELIDQGKHFSPKDPKDSDLTEDKEKYYHIRYTGCGLDDFDKNGERRSVTYRFCKHYSEKA